MKVCEIKLLRTFTLVFALFLSQLSFAQGIRAAYSYHAKRTPDGGFSRSFVTMTDYDGKRIVYYSDANFYRDSLKTLAFDESGNICNQEKYDEIFNYPAWTSKDVVFADYTKQVFETSYNDVMVCLYGTDGVLTLPEWNITDETKTTDEGFSVRKATASYMGRVWTVWFCTDIPYPTGPWLFWGAPGLIAEANDSENLFRFKLLFVSPISSEENRYERIYSYRHDISKRKKQYSYPVQKAEEIHNNLERDASLSDKMAGHKHYPSLIKGKDGTVRAAPEEFPYIPLISEDYWK